MLNKAILMHKTAKTTKLPLREVSMFIDIIFDVISEAISKGEHVELRNFGSFDISHVSAKRASIADVVVPPHGRIVFRPCQKLREAVWNKVN